MALGIPFRHHTNGTISIGTSIMSLDEFTTVYPSYSGLPDSAQGIPEGAKIVGCEYIAGSRHSIFTDLGGQHGGVFPWEEGDDITDSLDDITEKLDALRKPPPTKEQLHQEKINALRHEIMLIESEQTPQLVRCAILGNAMAVNKIKDIEISVIEVCERLEELGV